MASFVPMSKFHLLMMIWSDDMVNDDISPVFNNFPFPSRCPRTLTKLSPWLIPLPYWCTFFEVSLLPANFITPPKSDTQVFISSPDSCPPLPPLWCCCWIFPTSTSLCEFRLFSQTHITSLHPLPMAVLWQVRGDTGKLIGKHGADRRHCHIQIGT